jgi:hypothetical protein
MRESTIEKYLRAEIAKLGGTSEKFSSPGVRGKPDQLVCWAAGSIVGRTPSYGVPLTEFIETKAPNGKLSVLQQRDHKRRRDMGFEVHVIWTMEQAEAYLKSRGKR